MNVMEEVLRDKIDPSLTVRNLSALASRALGRDLTASRAEILTGGCWNRVIGVGLGPEEEELVFKINPEKGNPGIEREFKVLGYFAEHTEIPVPQPHLIDSSGENIPGTVLVMNKLPGKVMHHSYRFLDPSAREVISDEIGCYVRDLHKNKCTGFGGVEISEKERHANWPDFWIPRFDKVLKEVVDSGFLKQDFLDRVSQVRKHFPRFLEIGNESTVCHYDIWSGNVMIDTEAHKRPDGESTTGEEPPRRNHKKLHLVSGFIDVPGFCADYARELSFMLMFGVADRRFFARYTEAHEPDEGFELRVNIYNLKMHMKHITMYPREEYYRRGAEDCLRVIEKAVGETNIS